MSRLWGRQRQRYAKILYRFYYGSLHRFQAALWLGPWARSWTTPRR
jgi:hypothetical protein